MQTLRAAVAAVLDLVLPDDCAGCAAPGPAVCGPCVTPAWSAPRTVQRCPAPAGLPPVVAATPYADPVRRVLLAHKDGRTALVGPLAVLLAHAVRAALAATSPEPGRSAVLVPAPSDRRAVRARGHDHALRLAVQAARELRAGGVPARAVPALHLSRRVDDQGHLSARERVANLRGALGVRDPDRLARVAGSGVVLVVDDVCASGATLAEAARALAAAGRPAMGAAVVAAVLRDGPRPR